MSVSVERKGNEATLKVTLPVEDVAKAFEKAVAKINKQVTIPGFRKGKAPRRVLELHVGKDAIKEEAFEIAANSEYRETLKENKWVPVSDRRRPAHGNDLGGHPASGTGTGPV